MFSQTMERKTQRVNERGKMKHKTTTTITILILLFSLISFFALYGSDQQGTDKAPQIKPEKEKKITEHGEEKNNDTKKDEVPTENFLWKFSTQTDLTGTPVYMGNDIIVAAKTGLLFCISPNGEQRWKKKLPFNLIAPPSLDKSGNIYMAGMDEQLYCYDKKGEKKWTLPLEGIVRVAPIINNKYLYVTNDKGVIHAINLDTQKISWKQDLGLPVFAPPVFNHTKSIILVPTKDYYLIAVNVTDGKISWKFNIKGVIYSSPAVNTKGEIYLTSMNHFIFKLSPKGELIWKYKTGYWIIASPVIDAGDNVYFGGINGYFYCLDQAGKLKWKYNTKARFNATAVIDSEGTIYAGAADGVIHAFTPNGKVLWTAKSSNFIRSGFTIFTPGKILLVPGTDKHIHAYKINGELSQTAHWPLFLGNTRNSGYRK